MKVYRSLVVDALTELADPEYQERVWTGRDPYAMSSLTECVEELFDDSGLAHALERGSVFGSSIDRKLLLLGARLDAVDPTLPIPELLRDEALLQSRDLAADILQEVTLDRTQSDE